MLDKGTIDELINKTQYEFVFFGSEDSTDIDIMFFIDKPLKIEECRVLAKELKFALGLKYSDVNLCSVKCGYVNWCYKGTIDEVNNMIAATYKLHKQAHPCPIYEFMPRNINIKIHRVFRGILSHLSRTEFRPEIKKALRNIDNIKLVSEVLSKIKLSKIIDLKKNNSNLVNFYKFLGFQIGQVYGLIDYVELYTKIDIANKYPELTELLYRKSFDINRLDTILENFMIKINTVKQPWLYENMKMDLDVVGNLNSSYINYNIDNYQTISTIFPSTSPICITKNRFISNTVSNCAIGFPFPLGVVTYKAKLILKQYNEKKE
ncbi:MAG: hypothetical protein M0R17_03810 [Candidatus Omnitrophica bacterium]|jgi:hypothetical protein|nr:hypothetical protein [Candidatus Omnitrophota bacterium]